jgi:pimeloyl-ACP methyl ester carboxylesterase
VLAAMVVLTLAAFAPLAHAISLSRCSGDAQDRSLCGRVTVPLDRTGQVPGAISLNVRTLPPARGAATDTILALAGGPGQAATPLVGGFASVLGTALGTRQLVTFDQRGTGGSGELVCSALDGTGSLSAEVGGCASEIGPARIAYTTDESVQDVEAVREALGIDRVVLYGTSYGTKVALAYAAAYPQHVERLILDSVVPPQGVDPFERTTVASIPRILRTLCAGACRFTRDPAADLAALVRRLTRAPLRGTVLDGSGHVQHTTVVRTDLLGLLLAGDFDPYLRAAFPAAVNGALHGDTAPLLRLASGGGSDGPGAGADSDAVFVATSCEDGIVPWAPGTAPAQRRAAVDAAAAALPSSAFAPFDRDTVRAFGTADLCRAWPEAPIAQPQPVLPSTPTLVLSGDDDLRTPRADATALAARLPGAHLLRVPDAGHGTLFSDPTDCSAKAVAAFLSGAIPGACRAHAPIASPVPLAPLRLRQLHSIPGVAGRRSRTLRAVTDTLGDATQQLLQQLGSGASPQPFGGLRAGSAALGKRGLRLRGYAYVPGVTLTGVIPQKVTRFTMRIGGSAASHGPLTITAKGISGVLGGKRVKATAAALGWRTAKAASAGAAFGGQEPVLRLPDPLALLAPRVG